MGGRMSICRHWSRPSQRAYAPVAEEAGRDFGMAIAPGLHVPGDPALLQRMLANLLDNALTHGAGAIRVALTPGPALVVADDGPGVPAADRDAVLRRFVRLDQSRGTPGHRAGARIGQGGRTGAWRDDRAGVHAGGWRRPDGSGSVFPAQA